MDSPHVVPIGPEFDLHPFAPRDIADVVDAYLEEAHARGLRDVRLVHGRGIGVPVSYTHSEPTRPEPISYAVFCL